MALPRCIRPLASYPLAVGLVILIAAAHAVAPPRAEANPTATPSAGVPEVTVVSQAPLRAPRTEELGLTLTLRVTGVSAKALARCLARQDRPLSLRRDPEDTFRSVLWTPKERETLTECEPDDCAYELPKAERRTLSRANGLGEKMKVYYGLIAKMSARDKRKKDHRILPHQVSGEPCAEHDAFHWLLNGPVKPHDALVWRKFGPSKRMQPTMMTMQVYQWEAEGRVCVGQSLLFADHYYDDHLELFQLRPTGDGAVEVRFHTRSRFDFFESWWARRFRGTITSGLRDYTRKKVVKLVSRCAQKVAQKEAATR